MKVDRIQYYQKLFETHVKKHGLRGQIHRYETQYNWQQQWDIESLDMSNIYQNSLTSKVSARLWGGSTNSAKESMIAMIEANKEFMRSAFRDLFSVEKDLGLRCDRFLFYSDEALKSVKSSTIIDHYHDREMMCVYLAFEFPEKYTLYDYPSFKIMMEKLHARNIPSIHEIERYQKSMFAIHKVMSKDEAWSDIMRQAIGEYYIDNTLMVMSEFAEFVAQDQS